MTIDSLDAAKLREIAEIVASSATTDAIAWARVVSIAGDATLAKRASEWLPEAFGYVLVSHIPGDIRLPDTFQAKSADGRWHTFPFAAEPIARDAIALAMQAFHAGEKALFETLALRSGLLASVNDALNAGASVEGAALGGPAFVDLPAEIYACAENRAR